MARSSSTGTRQRIALDPSNPYYTASQFLVDHCTLDGVRAVQHHNGTFYRYRPESGYRESEIATLRAALYAYIARAPKAGGVAGEACKPTAARVNDVVDAMKALAHWPVETPPPCWLAGEHVEDPSDLLPCTNGTLHLPTRTLLPATPHLFALHGIACAYRPDAPTPTAWLEFLHQLLPEDSEAQDLLQEWIGYLLTTRTHQQKILLMVGPKRSGKGTIGRIIRELVGRQRLVSPTLSQLGEQFGRQPLIDKTVALIADARLSGRTDLAVLSEVLLAISGEDPQTIPRKNTTAWNGHPTVRFTIMTNEVPRIPDASGALASRFLVLLLRESFYGREDQTLFARLAAELPSILAWALGGLDRLATRGHFLQPSSALDAIEDLENLSSPVMAFVRALCVVKSGVSCPNTTLYAAYTQWARDEGQSHVDTHAVFGRNLMAALPFIGKKRLNSEGDRTRVYHGIALRSDMTPDDTYVV